MGLCVKILAVILLTLSGAGRVSASEFSSLPASKPIADEILLDQDGQKVRFYSDLIRGHRVVINFMFTSCAMVCPPMSAVSAKLAKDFEASGNGARVITVSIDPETDKPDVLKSHQLKFLPVGAASKRWTLLTGDRAAVSNVLASLGQSVSEMGNHDPLYIVGDDKAGRWKIVRGIASAATIKKALSAASAKPEKADAQTDSAVFRKYFTDTEFTDQTGRKLRLYSDLLKGRKVLVNFGFTRCTAICSPSTRNLAAVQKQLGDKMESEYRILTFTVDPDHDTPTVLREFAGKHGAGKGWYFLTGRKAQIQAALKKLGGWTEMPDNHSGVLMYGDVDHGIWSKSSSMDSPKEIAFAISNISVKRAM